MIHIHTWAQARHAVAHPPYPELALPLQAHIDRLAEFSDYDLGDLAEVIILPDKSDLSVAELAAGRPLVDRQDGRFAALPEYAVRHGGWVEVVWVLSDDGKGLVLFAEITSRTAPELTQACTAALDNPV